MGDLNLVVDIYDHTTLLQVYAEVTLKHNIVLQARTERFALEAGCHESQLTKQENAFERENAAKPSVAARPLAPKHDLGDHVLGKLFLRMRCCWFCKTF